MMAALLVGAAIGAAGVPAPSAAAAAATASEKALPTAQLDGVAFAQVVVGRTVFVGGRFSTARPAGAARGTRTVRRANLLAYDLVTGRVKSWHARTNGLVRGMAASADGRTLYLTGAFTEVGGASRPRIAAVSTSTGKVRERFRSELNGSGYGLAVHGGTLYAVGAFTAANRTARPHAASFDRVTGRLRRWAPSTDDTVFGVVVSRDGRSAVLGGRFLRVNGSKHPGSQRVTTTTGRKNLRWRIDDIVGNHGVDAAIYSLSTNGRTIIGTGYSYGSRIGQRRLEGAFVATWDGRLRWVEDCHGDSYSAVSSSGVVYLAGHPHTCTTVPGGFPESDPLQYRRALAFTASVAGELGRNQAKGYSDFSGLPAPRLLDWRPAFDAGSVTGQNQGPWTVVASGPWVLYAGEFTTVNGERQQGLVRFRR